MTKPSELDDLQKKEGRIRRHFSIRINTFFFATFLLFSVLIIRLAYLQFVEGPQLASAKVDQARKNITIPPIRGNIVDINNAPIASTASTQSLYYQIMPGQKTSQQVELANKLADIFAKYGDKKQVQPTAQEIFEAMDTGKNMDGSTSKKAASYSFWPRRIKSGLNNKEIAYLAEHNDEFPGVDVSEESTRIYDPETIAVQMIGYLRPYKGVANRPPSWLDVYKNKEDEYLQEEFVGFDGLEFMYQDDLRGKNGTKSYPVNAMNQITGQVEITPPEKGHNLVLAMNKDMQLATENAIMDHLDYLHKATDKMYSQGKNAQAGYAVAMEVDTGKIMAMASMPDYDPSVFSKPVLSQEDYKNNQILEMNGTIRDRQANIADDKERRKHPSSIVPLGSTIKPLSVLMGLNEKLITPDTVYYDTGVLHYGKDNKATITNSDSVANGPINAAKALTVSSNTFMGQMIGLGLYNKYPGKAISIFDSYMEKFGLGVSTESGLPLENTGVKDYMNTKATSDQNNLVMGAFGQMGRYTTLQLAQYAAMLANHGKRMKPQFLDRITTYDNVLIKKMEPVVLNEAKFPDEDWKVLRDGMKSGVEGFDDFPYGLVRKTGTSEQDVAGQRINNAVFIGYAPADNPKLAVAVVVPEGGFGRYGAAPIARKIFDAYDQYFGLDGVPKAPTKAADQAPAGEAGVQAGVQAGAAGTQAAAVPGQAAAANAQAPAPAGAGAAKPQ